jgi:amino acid permease
MYSFFNFTKVIILVSLGLVAYIIYKWLQDMKQRRDDEHLKEREDEEDKEKLEAGFK